jgi:hypothetical protein
MSNLSLTSFIRPFYLPLRPVFVLRVLGFPSFLAFFSIHSRFFLSYPDTLSATSLDEGSARHKDLYLTTQNTHNTQTFMSPAGFHPTIHASERTQTNASDSTATELGHYYSYFGLYL